MAGSSGEKDGTDRRKPPRRRAGQGQGPRRFRGKVLDVASLSERCGWSEKTTRARVSRRLLPFHRWGGRIVFLEEEVDEFFKRLPGTSPEEALHNERTRNGE